MFRRDCAECEIVEGHVGWSMEVVPRGHGCKVELGVMVGAEGEVG